MVSADADSIATAVRMELARHRMPIKTLAAELGVKQQYLSRRLNGVVPFAADEVARIADVLDVPVADFYRVGRSAGKSEQHSVSPAPNGAGEPGSRERKGRTRRLRIAEDDAS